MSLRIYTAYLNNIIKCVEGYKPKLLHELSHLSDIVTTVKELDDLFYMEELLVHAEGEFELISSYLFLYEPLPISTRERLEKSGKPREVVNAIIENLGELINDDFDVDIDEVFDSDGIFDSPTNIVQEFESQHIESYLDTTSNDGVFDEISIYDGSDDEEELEDEEDEYPMDMDDFDDGDLEDDDSEDGVVFEDEYPMEDEDLEDFEDEYPMEDDEEDLLDEEGYGDTYLDEDDYPIDDGDDDYPMDDEDDDEYPMDDEDDDEYPMDDEEDIEDSWDEPDDEYDMDLEDEDEYDDEYGMEDEYDDEYDMDSDDEDEYDMESEDDDEYDMDSEDEDEYDMESEDDDEYDMDFDDEIEDDDFENDIEGFVSTPKKNNIDFTNNFGENLKPLGKSDSSFHQDLSSSRAIENSFSLGGTPVQPSEKTIDDRIADNIVKLYDYLVQGYRKAKEVIIVDEEE